MCFESGVIHEDLDSGGTWFGGQLDCLIINGGDLEEDEEPRVTPANNPLTSLQVKKVVKKVNTFGCLLV